MASYVNHSAFHKTHVLFPGQLVFRSDTFVPIDVPIDWITIKEQNTTQFQYTRGDYISFQNPSVP